MAFNFISNNNNNFIIFIYSFGAIVIFEKFNSSLNYYNLTVLKFYFIQRSLILWSALMLIFSKVLLIMKN